jgi:hypothetical protein
MELMSFNTAIRAVKAILKFKKNLSVFLESETRKIDITNDIIPFVRGKHYYIVLSQNELIIHVCD